MTQTGEWDNYWQGRTGDAANALTGVENDRELADFWRKALTTLKTEAPCLDLACGAGTVLRHAQACGFTHLTGADYSPAAIAALETTLPQVQGVVCSADQTPFADAHFAVVTSQFGVEYAGAQEAVREIVRILAPGGQFIAVMHQTGGAIAAEVAGHLHHATTIAQSRFIPLAKALFSAAMSADAATAQPILAQLTQASEQVAGLLKPDQPSLARHLLDGSAQLWARRQAYHLDDIHTWLDGMETERAAYAARMQAMLDAAQDAKAMAHLSATLHSLGCHTVTVSPLALGGRDAAWVLRAQKQA